MGLRIVEDPQSRFNRSLSSLWLMVASSINGVFMKLLILGLVRQEPEDAHRVQGIISQLRGPKKANKKGESCDSPGYEYLLADVSTNPGQWTRVVYFAGLL